jgi:hypothetical protein
LKLGVLQLYATIGDFQTDRGWLLPACREAGARGAEFVVTPGCHLCGCRPCEILEAHPGRNLLPADVMALGSAPAVVNDVIDKVTFSEYKRRPAAPGLEVSPRAFGMGRRIPIAPRFRAVQK